MGRHRKVGSRRHTQAVAALATIGAAALTLGLSGTALAATTTAPATGPDGTGLGNVGDFGEFTDIGDFSGLVSGFVRALTTTPYFPGQNGDGSGGFLG
jgi:hypothetical protein